MSTETDKAPAPVVDVRLPSLRALLFRGVRALERIVDELELVRVELEQRGLRELDGAELAPVDVPRCGALYMSKDANRPFHALETMTADGGTTTVGAIHCDRELDEHGKHVRVHGISDDVHACSTENGTMCWTDNEVTS